MKILFSILAIVLVFGINISNANAACLFFGGGLCKSACLGDKEQMVKDIFDASPDERVCALSLAKDGSVIHWMAQNGVDVSVQKKYSNKNSPSGRTALFRVIFKGNQDLFDALLEENINVNLQDSKGDTALMMAVGAGRVYMVEKLLAAGADINVRNRFGSTALCVLRQYLIVPNRDEVEKILISKGAVCD